MVRNTDYVAVAAGQTGSAVGPAKLGVLLDRLIVTVATAATSTVTLTDGNVDTVLVPANTPVGVYTITIGARSKGTTTPGWKVTTGAGAAIIAVGSFVNQK